MKQALHILAKDIRFLRLEAAVTLALTICFLAAALIHARENPFALPIVPLSWWMVARAIHAEPLIGDRQFWVTRPYAWRSLLASKLLLILIFGILPSTILRATILVQEGFPLGSNLAGLIWSEMLPWAAGFVPFAALAAVVPGTISLMLTILLLLGGLNIGYASFLMRWPERTVLDSLDWIRNSFAALAVVLLAANVLRSQYRRRATAFSRVVLIAGAVATLSVYLFFPWPAAFAIQRVVAAGNYDGLPLRFEPVPGWGTGLPDKEEVGADVVFQIDELPPDMRARIDSLNLELVWPDGRRFKTAQREMIGLEPHIENPDRFTGVFSLRRSLLTQGRDIAVHGTVWLTLLGDPQSKTIRIGKKPVLATSDLACMRSGLSSLNEVFCLSPFRWPSGMVTASFGGTDIRPVGHDASWSPFPADLDPGPDPSQVRSVYGSAPAGSFEMTVKVYRPVAHIKRDFVWNGMEMPEGRLTPSQSEPLRNGRKRE